MHLSNFPAVYYMLLFYLMLTQLTNLYYGGVPVTNSL